MSEEQYEKLLESAFSKLPQLSKEKSDFVIPRADVLTQGTKTMIRNMAAIADRARRKQDDIARYVSKELSVPVSLEEGRLIINGKFSQDDIDRRINKYFEMYVICKECHKPDTHLENAEKGMYLVCEACGARYWVKNY
ncbi:MAG: translation initiation factor IF-2 subunit beta [Candidatus Micrarchaeota archaeon]|nr:translation initiation factor IF-2 subunit beta [Candidatus Micrarchaeota archaeon]